MFLFDNFIIYKKRYHLSAVKRILSYITHKHQFKEIHRSDIIKKPIIITPQYISLGENVYIGYHARIEGISLYAGIKYTPLIRICDGVTIQQNIHLTCANIISIGKNTAVAANVTITDIHHPYTDIRKPIERQCLEVGTVQIGEDCKIYNNAVILPNTKIGKHVTVGANSVVSGEFPDYCVIVGAPAKIVKRYDFCNCKWRNTNSKGVFEEQE